MPNFAGANVDASAVDTAIRGPLFVWSDPDQLREGEAGGLYINVGSSLVPTPGRDDLVGGTIRVTNDRLRNKDMWGLDIVVQMGARTPYDASRGLALHAVEGELGNAARTPDELERDPFLRTPGKIRTNSFEAVGMAGYTSQNTAAFTAWANSTTGGSWWVTGLAISRTSDVGVLFVKDPGGAKDAAPAFTVAAIHDRSDSASVLRVAGSHGAIVDLQDNPGISTYLRGFTDRPTNLLFRNFADWPVNMILDSGQDKPQHSYYAFADRGRLAWSFLRAPDDSFHVFNHRTGRSAVACRPGGVEIDGGLTVNGRAFYVDGFGYVRAR